MKITNYILNDKHSTGKHKEKYFTNFGFKLSEWEVLANSFKKHCRDNKVTRVIENEFGKKYIITGRLKTPDNRDPEVRTIWFIESNKQIPEFITAYPN